MHVNNYFFRSKVFICTLIIGISVIPIGCKTSRAVKGGAIGAGSGAVIGGAIGSASDKTILGAIIGAAVGGTAGALIGNYMDKQAREIERDMKGATVERIGEGIKITFDSGLLFDVGSYQLKSASRTNLQELAGILSKYEDTDIVVEGHTDSSGSDETNQTLSDQRATSVSNYLRAQGIAGTRFLVFGYGESQPVADNSTDSGRRQNRRVDIAIFANKKLKKAAKRGDIGQ